MRCARCGADLTRVGHAMSYFNEDMCCLECLNDEQGAPGFERAKRMEESEVAKGNTNYPGMGLTTADAEFLAAKRAARRVEA